ncbi:hypothetical protein VTN77DRAFT_2381 [Rasamsonia byssochlamydoides]|uniref:uncharacterized protein n=1 Tax=Rasamsonia byssochlamydoides TaxID=89139 RepID=UPI00374214E5
MRWIRFRFMTSRDHLFSLLALRVPALATMLEPCSIKVLLFLTSGEAETGHSAWQNHAPSLYDERWGKPYHLLSLLYPPHRTCHVVHTRTTTPSTTERHDTRLKYLCDLPIVCERSSDPATDTMIDDVPPSLAFPSLPGRKRRTKLGHYLSFFLSFFILDWTRRDETTPKRHSFDLSVCLSIWQSTDRPDAHHSLTHGGPLTY